MIFGKVISRAKSCMFATISAFSFTENAGGPIDTLRAQLESRHGAPLTTKDLRKYCPEIISAYGEVLSFIMS